MPPSQYQRYAQEHVSAELQQSRRTSLKFHLCRESSLEETVVASASIMSSADAPPADVVTVKLVEDGGEGSSETRANIPAAIFFEDVAAAVEEHGVENLIDQLSTLNQKYRLCVSSAQSFVTILSHASLLTVPFRFTAWRSDRVL
jgi:hypothetical protein